MNRENDFALVPRAPGALEKAEPGAKRILSGMIAETLALVKKEPLPKACPIRIVVVFEEEGPRESINIILRTWFNKDATVVTFADSEMAWQELAQTDHDLLITDYRMSRLSGKEILQRLLDRKATYPIILMSGMETTDLLMWVRECASRGLNIKFLNLPFNITLFLKVIAASLRLPFPDSEKSEILRDTTAKPVEGEP